MKNPVRALTLTLALALAATAALAQSPPRTLPDRARLGTLEIVVFPKALLDGKEITMAPGTRIMGTSGMLATPGSLRGPLPVLYRTDMLGQVNEAWILTPEELRKAQQSAGRQGGATR
jgi:hypothetical protein